MVANCSLLIANRNQAISNEPNGKASCLLRETLLQHAHSQLAISNPYPLPYILRIL